jgi:UDP-glucuronate 4-epimerase
MRILVTGAAGFIGAHLTAKLIAEDHDVVAVDNFNEYYSPELKIRRVSELLTPLGVQVQNVALDQHSLTSALFNINQFDCVYHLAAQAGVRIPIEDYTKYVTNNLVAFSNVITCAAQANVENFLYASSSSVYGNSPQKLFSEKDVGLEPISFYGATKLANEVLAKSLSAVTGMKTRGLRFFTVYGPWGRPDMAYFRIFGNILGGYEFNLMGDGNVVRDFTYIDDVISTSVKLGSELGSHATGFSDVVNVGAGNPVSLDQMIAEIEKNLKARLSIQLQSRNRNDVIRTSADSNYLSKLIGENRITSLGAGIKLVSDWAKSPEVSVNLAKWSNTVA